MSNNPRDSKCQICMVMYTSSTKRCTVCVKRRKSGTIILIQRIKTWMRGGWHIHLCLCCKTTRATSLSLLTTIKYFLARLNDDTTDIIVHHLSTTFEVRVLNRVELFLGMIIEDSGMEIKLHTSSFSTRLLDLYGMDQCKPVATPLLTGYDPTVDSSPSLPLRTRYRQLIESLIHFVNTVWPNMSCTVYFLAWFLHNPTNELWKASKRVLRYLKESTEHYIWSTKEEDEVAVAYADAGRAQWKPSRNSISENSFILSNGFIRWRSKR